MATPPPPQRKSTFRSRVGGAIRRSSTAFSIPGLPNRGSSSTPPPSQDSDTASIAASLSGKLDREGSTTSLNKIDTTPPQAPVPISSAPSPIPESPAREAAAMAAEPQAAAIKAPSPLANEVLKADSASKQGSTPPRSISGIPPASESVPATMAPPPQPSAEIAPVLTDEPEEIPVQQAAAASPPSSRPASKSGNYPPPASAPPSAPVTPAVVATSTSGYFDIPRSTTPIGLDSDPDMNVWADNRGGTATGSETGSEAPRGRVLANKPSKSSLRPRDSSVSSQVAPPLPQSRTTSRKASGIMQSRQTELAGVTKTWSSSSDMGFASLPLHDDGKPVVVQGSSVPVVSPTETVHVPDYIDPRSPRDDTMLPSEPQVPLPAMHEVMATGPLRSTSSSHFDRSLSDSGRFYPRPTDETRPLISRPSTPPIITNFFAPQTASSHIAQSYRSAIPLVNQPVPQWAQPARFDVNGSARGYAYGSTSRPHVNRGWTEYALPHGVRYYVNEDNRTITDLDIRGLTRLDEVSNTIETSDDVPEGCEMWIRAGINTKKGWRKHKAGGDPTLLWVDHRHRRVLSEAPSDDYASSGEDDRLDDEYRYWAFIEMHPAHIPRGIVESARRNAIDALHWSYTDRLLTHPHLPPTPPPFSQDECIELFKLLNGEVEFLSLTRQVRGLIAIPIPAHWHQVNFRPHKPLPRDVSYQQPARSTPIIRTILELLFGILCLGIPFLFEDRARYHGHFDVEGSHLPESTTPLFVIGACACLVSAIVLSASVTLMSFPGLDSITRIGGLVAITCSVLSMVTSFASIFRYKTEMARGTGPSTEGFVMLSRRSILLSLPLVFLAYSVAGFVTGVVIYSFRSATINFASAGSPVAAKFDEYTRCMVVGVLGALVGVLIASTMVARR
ncbi:hypothetical protein JVT61DRAFT_6059 [Boletus reticuloceps]|uniref:Uncharacterized protein n=1 Tax=Boletus reticuloceps TaxID=495285 RepID=A0A8I3A6X4_9AGAM|nr:hypothetical protein JVT61DRAFT_6059 [Boletus reticuloceps]